MKIFYNDECIVELSDLEIALICDRIHEDEFHNEMKWRIKWNFMRDLEIGHKKLREEWIPKLAASGVDMLPTDPLKFAQLVLSHPEYQSRKQRDEQQKKLHQEAVAQ